MRFNQIEYAGFYHKQMIGAGYPGKLLPFILKELVGSSSVIDIGSGTGFFSIPLAEAGHSVTAVEPSGEMINIMEQNSSGRVLSSIKICRSTWEDWEGPFHDAAICVHSLYPMADVKNALSLMGKAAAKKILIVRDSSGMKTLSGLVRDRLGLSSNRDLNTEIAAVLSNDSLNWKVENIYEERKHVVGDIRVESESIRYQLKLDVNFSDEIFNIVKSVLISKDGVNFFNAIYSDNAYIFN